MKKGFQDNLGVCLSISILQLFLPTLQMTHICFHLQNRLQHPCFNSSGLSGSLEGLCVCIMFNGNEGSFLFILEDGSGGTIKHSLKDSQSVSAWLKGQLHGVCFCLTKLLLLPFVSLHVKVTDAVWCLLIFFCHIHHFLIHCVDSSKSLR